MPVSASLRRLFLALCVPALVGCASAVVHAPARLQASPDTARGFALAADVTIVLDTGYERHLASGTAFRPAGEIPQGRVFRPSQGFLTIEGANIHEAYLVMDGERLVGFYLPVEESFSPLARELELATRPAELMQ